MPFEVKLALKYFRARRQSLARFTSAVAVVGIAAGVASLIIAQSLARGFADEMRDNILSNTSHISIFLKDGGEIFNWREIRDSLKNFDNIREISPTAYENAVLIGEKETSYAILKVQDLKSAAQSSEIALGKQLAEKLQLKVGDAAEIATLDNQTPSRVRVAEIFATGVYDYDAAWIYLSPENHARLRGQPSFTPTILSVSVADIYQSDETAEKLRRRLGDDYKIIDWQEANRPLFSALSLERKMALAIISLIIFIAALNITTTLALLVYERRLDIAILRTCGAKTRSLISIFLLEGLFLGLAGILFGLCLGLFGCFLGNYFKLISLSAEVYSLSYINLHPHIFDLLVIIFITFFVCLAATIYPSLKASRIKPLENLRAQ